MAQENELLVVAPATADLLARSPTASPTISSPPSTWLSQGPVVLAPAMNTNMWEHPATQANLEIAARARPHRRRARRRVCWPAARSAPAAWPRPSQIAGRGRAALRPRATDLEGETVLITAGPTQEPLDPVRYISNRSSGKMGYALAEAAAWRGARVILVTGPVHLDPPDGAEVDPGAHRAARCATP